MSRRSHVVRSNDKAGIGAPRSLGGATTIWCFKWEGSGQQFNDSRSVGEIPVTASGPYQRFFASATINELEGYWDPPEALLSEAVNVSLVYTTGDDHHLMGSMVTSGGAVSSYCITGAADLPAGDHLIQLWMMSRTEGQWVSHNGFGIQVIEGQVIDDPGCIIGSGGGG